MTEANKKLIERAANLFKKNDELFEAVARLIDFRMDFDEHKWEDKKREAYCSLRHEVRMQMIEAGYCVTCYNFNASKAANCVIYVDKIQVFKGIIRLLEITIDRGSIEYECVVFGELGGIFS